MIVVAALILGVRRDTAARRADQLLVFQSSKGPIQRADIGNRSEVALFGVEDDAVAVALASGEAQEDIELNGAKR